VPVGVGLWCRDMSDDAAAYERESADNASLEGLLRDELRADDNCIDVGANEGRFLGAMLAGAPRGRHIACEPIPVLAQQLRDRFPSVDVHEVALSDAPGCQEFVLVPDSMGYSGLRERTYPDAFQTQKITVRVARLDDVLADDYAPRVLKVDVEGAELQVFRGAMSTLTRYRPIVVFEHGIGAADHYGTTPQDVYELLVDGAGLHIHGLAGDARPYSLDEFVDAFSAGRRWNWIARP
jgi:FkbM family methyltransferase